jgi:transcriptional regulator with XRE-family HTH domain
MIMTGDESFAARFREVTQGQTQAEVARLLGITPSYVGKLQRGEYRPSRELGERIIEGYGLPGEEWRTLMGFGPEGEHQAPDEEQQALARVVAEEVVRRLRGERDSPANLLIDGWVERRERHPHLDIPFPILQGGSRSLTEEKVESILADIDRKIERGVYPKQSS